MEFYRLQPDDAAIRRYLAELWIPYNRELEELVDGFALADDVDLVAEELEFRRNRLETVGNRTWLAVDGSIGEDGLADADVELVGFIATEIDDCPPSFDRPDRLYISDIYIRPHCRGTGLAGELVERASGWARENGCAELELDVDVGNERAAAFYENRGFEPSSRTLVADVDGS